MVSVRIIVVRGNFAEGNFGDDALLLAVQQLLAPHYPSEMVRFDCSSLAYRNGTVGATCLTQMDDLQRADAIVYGGGTQFFSFAGRESARSTLGRKILRVMANPAQLIKRYRAHQRACWEAKIPRLGVGLGFGPFIKNSIEEREATALAARMKFLWVRDRVAAHFGRQAGCQYVTLGSDPCFLPEFQQIHLSGLSARGVAGQARLGIVLRDWHYGPVAHQCIAPYLEIAGRCRAKGIVVEFMVFSPNCDTTVLRQLRQAGQEVRCWSPENMLVADYARLLNRYDLVLTMRFHGAIFSILLGKPFIAIDIEPKLRMVGELLGGDEFVVAPTPEPAALVRKIEQMLSNVTSYRALVGHVRAEQTQQAAAAKVEFDAALRRLRSH